MPRKFLPKVATANDLFEGDTIYFTKDGAWTRSHAHADVALNEDQAAELLSKASAFPGQTVGVYLADAEINTDCTPAPLHFREVFRTRGPSNYFHGKQAEV